MLMPIVVLWGIGFVAAVILGVASRIFYVEENPQIKGVLSLLPGANCGGCGFAGCSSCAEAIVNGNAQVNACVIGQNEVANQIAEYLGVPKGIIDRTPTTDTYSAEQTQEEFFYEFPHDIMDLLWYAYENDYDPAEVGEVMDMTAEEIERNYRNFEWRSETTEYLRTPPINDYIFI